MPVVRFASISRFTRSTTWAGSRTAPTGVHASTPVRKSARTESPSGTPSPALGDDEHSTGDDVERRVHLADVRLDDVTVLAGLGGERVHPFEQPLARRLQPVVPVLGLVVGEDLEPGLLEQRAVIVDLPRPPGGLARVVE